MAAVSGTGDVDQVDPGACDRQVRFAVEDHPRRVHQNIGGCGCGAAAQHRGGDMIVRKHFKYAVARGDHMSPGTCGRDIGLDTKNTAVGSGLDRGEGFGVSGQLAHQRNRMRQDRGGIRVALSRIDLQVEGRAQRDLLRRRRVRIGGKEADARCQCRQRQLNGIRRTGRIRALITEIRVAGVVQCAGGIAMHRDAECHAQRRIDE